MHLSSLNVYIFTYYFSLHISLSFQLAVSKNFPIYNINQRRDSYTPTQDFFQCLNAHILPKVGIDQCEYSVTTNALARSSSTLICRDIIFMVALETESLRTVSEGIFFARNHNRLKQHEIYKLRHSLFCRIVISDEGQISNLEDSPDTFSESDVFGTFYVLILGHQESLKNEKYLNDFSIFQKLRFIVFVSCNHLNNSVNKQHFQNFLITSFNWNKLPLISTSDITVPRYIESYKKTGKWTHFILAAYHYVTSMLNATNDHILVSAPPKSKSFENGVWDEYVKPVVFMEAHISATRIPHDDIGIQYVYQTVPVFFDHFTFISAVPRDSGSNAFFASLNDLIIIFGSIVLTTFGVCTVKLVEKILSTTGQWNSSVINVIELIGTIVGVFITITKPILDQPMISQTTQLSVGLYIVFALWLVMIMQMSNVYKCHFVSEIVSPSFERIPETFENLIDLKFKTKAIFYKGNLELKFAGVQNSINNALLEQTEECFFFDLECCYQNILRWDTACLGSKMTLQSLATSFLVDKHGNKMFKIAPVEEYPFFTSNGVSKYFPEVLEYLNFVTTQMEENGLKKHILVLGGMEEKKNGRELAKHQITPSSEFYLIYQGSAFETGSSDGKLVMFLLKFLFVPLSVSVLVFFIEIVKLRWGSFKMNSSPSKEHLFLF